MDFYPTRYSDLSNEEVNELYRSEAWDALSGEERLDALQELENRTAAECGNQPCEITIEQMNGPVCGFYCDGQIAMNQDLVENGAFRALMDDGSTMSYERIDANAQLMDTIHHENYHAYQDEAMRGQVEHANAEELELWKANDSNYAENYPFYRMQSLESTAFERGEMKTQEAFQTIESQYGDDAGYQEYLDAIEDNSYENALAEAREVTGDENIQETYDRSLLDAYHAELASNSEASAEVHSAETPLTGDSISEEESSVGELDSGFESDSISDGDEM